jgi:small-conductance mechanosensitive channel
MGWARDWTSTHPCTTQTLPFTLQYITPLAIVTAIVITIITIAIVTVPFYVNVT